MLMLRLHGRHGARSARFFSGDEKHRTNSLFALLLYLRSPLGVRVRRPLTHSDAVVASQLGLGAGSGERFFFRLK